MPYGERIKKKSRRENRINLFEIIAYACYFAPEPYAVSRSILFGWRLLICITSTYAIYSYIRYKKLSIRWLCLVFSVLAYYLLSSFIKEANPNWLLIGFYTIDVIGFITLLDYRLSNDFEQSLKSFILAGIIMCGVHYITFLMYRDVPFGMRHAEMSALKYQMEDGIWFFLKHDNGSVFYFIPVLSAMWYSVCEFNKFKTATLICSALTLYMYWSQWSVAAMIVTTFMVVCSAMIYLRHNTKPLLYPKYKTLLLTGLCICVLVIYIVSSPSDYLLWFSNLVKRSTSFSGRAIIWPRAIEVIKSSPIIGIGCEPDVTTILRLGNNHCHNMILQILYTGGFITFVLMVVGLFLCDGSRRTKSITKGQSCISIAMLSLLVASSVDWYLYLPVQFAIYLIHYNSQFFTNIVNE